MNPTYQTVLHDPESGQHGNCLSAVVASLLHLPIEDVPLFIAPSWQSDLNAFLRPFGLGYLQVGDFERWCDEVGIKFCFHEVAGPSPRHDDVFHACVGINGKVVFDPHPGSDGLKDVQTCGIFIALQPWRMVEMRAQIASLASAIEGMVGATSITELQEMLQALKPLAQDNIDAAAGVVAIEALLNLRKGEVPAQPQADQAYDGDRP
jgi:hypothetical protein